MLLESFMVLSCFLLVAVLVGIALLILVLPITNYHHTDGVIEHKNKFQIVSQCGGVIQSIFVQNEDEVHQGSKILLFHSEENYQKELQSKAKQQLLYKELSVLQKLVKSGVGSEAQVEAKLLEIHETKLLIDYYAKNTLHAPMDGKIHFNILPQHMRGTYIKLGQPIAYVYGDDAKHVKLTFPNNLNDRFPLGAKVMMQYKDPSSFIVGRMEGEVYKRFFNDQNNQVELYCEVTKGKALLHNLQPSTVIRASVLLNSTSIANDLFGVDFAPFWIKSLIQKMADYFFHEMPWIQNFFHAETQV